MAWNDCRKDEHRALSKLKENQATLFGIILGTLSQQMRIFALQNLLMIFSLGVLLGTPLAYSYPLGLSEGMRANTGVSGLATPASAYYNPALLTDLDFRSRDSISSGQTVIHRFEQIKTGNTQLKNTADVSFDTLLLSQAGKWDRFRYAFVLVKTPTLKYRIGFSPDLATDYTIKGEADGQSIIGLFSGSFLPNEESDLAWGFQVGLSQSESSSHYLLNGVFQNKVLTQYSESRQQSLTPALGFGFHKKWEERVSWGANFKIRGDPLSQTYKQYTYSAFDNKVTKDIESDMSFKTEQRYSGTTGVTVHQEDIDYSLEFGYAPSYKEYSDATVTHYAEMQTYALGVSKKWSDLFQTRWGYSYSLHPHKGYTDLATIGLIRQFSHVEMGLGIFSYNSKMKPTGSTEDEPEQHYRFYGFQVGSTVYY